MRAAEARGIGGDCGSPSLDVLACSAGLTSSASHLLHDWATERSVELTIVEAPESLPSSIEAGLLIASSRIGLPRFDLLVQLRAEHSNTQLFVVDEDGGSSVIPFLGAGADDICAPSRPLELLERLDRCFRRATETLAKVLRCGPLEIDLHSREARLDRKRFVLRNAEFVVLAYLVTHRQRPISVSELKTRALRTTGDEHTIRNHIYELRKKLREAGLGRLLETVPGEGYRICP